MDDGNVSHEVACSRIHATEFDMVALMRRGLRALLDDAHVEIQFASRYAAIGCASRGISQASAEAKTRALVTREVAAKRLLRFSALYPPSERFELQAASPLNPRKIRSAPMLMAKFGCLRRPRVMS
jgi:hypothetical protein